MKKNMRSFLYSAVAIMSLAGVFPAAGMNPSAEGFAPHRGAKPSEQLVARVKKHIETLVDCNIIQKNSSIQYYIDDIAQAWRYEFTSLQYAGDSSFAELFHRFNQSKRAGHQNFNHDAHVLVNELNAFMTEIYRMNKTRHLGTQSRFWWLNKTVVAQCKEAVDAERFKKIKEEFEKGAAESRSRLKKFNKATRKQQHVANAPTIIPVVPTIIISAIAFQDKTVDGAHHTTQHVDKQDESNWVLLPQSSLHNAAAIAEALMQAGVQPDFGITPNIAETPMTKATNAFRKTNLLQEGTENE